MNGYRQHFTPDDLEDIVCRWPGSVSLLADAHLAVVAADPPTSPDLRARVWAEVFVRHWLYGIRCPPELTRLTDTFRLSEAFRTAFREKAVSPHEPPANSEPNYDEILSAPSGLERDEIEVWETLKIRLTEFLECDGVFLLYHRDVDGAVLVPFCFRSEREFLNKVHDSKKEIPEWSRLLGKLPCPGRSVIGIQVMGEFPTDLRSDDEMKEIGGSLALALVLARERRRNQEFGWYWPLDLVATGAIQNRRLSKVDGVNAKCSAAQRAGCRLVIWPGSLEEDTSDETLLPLALGSSVEDCVEAVASSVNERGLDRLTFHRACLCLRQAKARKPGEAAHWEDAKEIELQLEHCRSVFEKSKAKALTARERLRECEELLREARHRRWLLRGRLPLLVGFVALILLALVWQWQEHRKAEVARLGNIESFTEQGRQELLAGSPLRALPFLAEAYREGGTGTGLRLLLAQAINAIDSRVVSFGGPSDGVHYATFSPDGDRLLTASANNDVKVWDAATGKLLLTLPEACERMFRPAFSPDGSLIATARGRTAKLWRTADGKLQASLIGHKFDVKTVAFSADGARLVTASVDDTANIWETTEGKLLVSMIGHSATVRAAVFSPDGRRVLTVSADETAKVWDATTGALVVTLLLKADGVRPTPSLVNCDCFSPDSSRILTLSGNQVASVWSAESGKRLAVLRADKPKFRSVMFSRDGTRALAFSPADDNKINVWDIESEKVVMTLDGHNGWINAIESNSSGSRFVTASWDTTARVWDAVSGRELRILEGHKGFLVTSASYSHDGTHVVTVDGDGYARVWDMTGGKLVSSFQDRSNHIRTLAFSPDGTRIITAGADRSLTIWNAMTWQRESLLTNFTYPVTSAAFTHNGNRIVTANGFGSSPLLHDPMARVLDAKTGRLFCSLGPHSNAVSTVGFSPDGNRVYTTSGEAAHLWDATSGNLDVTFIPPRQSWIVAAGFNSDSSKTFIATYDRSGLADAKPDDVNAVEVWDFETKRLVSTLATPNAFFYSVSFTRDSSKVLTASADHNVTVWDTLTGRALTSLHANIPFGGLARWNRDGSLILTTDGSAAKLWDAASGKLLTTLEGHTSRINFARFSGNGSHIATASEEGDIKIWSVNLETRTPEEIVRLIEALVPWRLADGQLIPAVNTEH